jgi:hypothetical protein
MGDVASLPACAIRCDSAATRVLGVSDKHSAEFPFQSLHASHLLGSLNCGSLFPLAAPAALAREGSRRLDAGIDNKNRHLVTVSKDTLRARATKFIADWEGQHRERSECQVFWHEFFAMFDVRSVDIGMYEEAAKRASTGGDGRIDYLIPWELAIEHKTTGEDLDKAMGQLIDYLPSLKQKQPPRLLVTCDFANFQWHNLETGESGAFPLDELISNLDLFWWLAGHTARGAEAFEDEEEANLKATDLMAKLYDAVVATGYDEHALREWLTRILFCLFADDTDVWPRNAFVNFIHFRTQSDGTDLGPQIRMLFEVLNMQPDERRRRHLSSELDDFTYINGDLFANDLPMVWTNEDVRTYLLDACRFDWSRISPAIFGSMFQNVMTPVERRHLGAHYTTLENILKTIRPLFLDELEEELAKANTVPALERFHDKIASLTFMDPACGCGNFLVVAYGELRRLEQECLEKIRDKQGRGDWQTLGVHLLFKVNVSQFYGIELEEFPARIARTALYLMDHSWNREVSKVFGQYFVRFPIPASPHIVIGNALRIDWKSILPPSDANYIMGNPPFVGSRMASAEQKLDQEAVWAGNRLQGKLDFVTNWYKLASEYMDGTTIRAAFVSTNSISQGEQPAILWGELWTHHMSIDFAHRTFAWSSEAKGKAAVHVVIIGFSQNAQKGHRHLWSYPDLKGPPGVASVKNISPYLIDSDNTVVESRQAPLVGGTPPMFFGSMPRDSGHISNISPGEAQLIRDSDPIAAKYLRNLIGADELINSGERYCLWLVGADPTDVSRSPILQQRLEAVRSMRLASKAASTRAAAATPGLFVQLAQPSVRYLAVPSVSSETRPFLITSFFEADVIASNLLLTIPGAELALFGVISSSMFMAWNRTVSGRLKSDMRLSQEITYNNFPFPEVTGTALANLESASQGVLDAREKYPNSSLAQLYGHLSMPIELVKAHAALDRAVDPLFAPRKKFATDADRLAVLFERYQTLTSMTNVKQA